MFKALLKRKYYKTRTLGELTIFNDKDVEVGRFYTLELPYLNNQQNISCINEGVYLVIPNNTSAHPDTYRVLNVLGRSGILFHIGNYPRDVRGCILVGLKRIDLDGDGLPEVGESTKGMKSMFDIIGLKSFKLTIYSDEKIN